MIVLIIGWLIILISAWNIFKWYYAEAIMSREFAILAYDLVLKDKSPEALTWVYVFISKAYDPSTLKKAFSYKAIRKYFGLTDTQLDVVPEIKWLIENHPYVLYRTGMLIVKISFLVHPIYMLLLLRKIRKISKNHSSNLDGSQFLETLAHAH